MIKLITVISRCYNGLGNYTVDKITKYKQVFHFPEINQVFPISNKLHIMHIFKR